MVIAPAMLGATMVAPTKPARARGRYFFKGPPEDVGGWPGSWECRSARAGRRGKAAFRLAVTLPSTGAAPSAIAVSRYLARCFEVPDPGLCGSSRRAALLAFCAARRSRVFRLVEAEFAAVGHPDGRHPPPRLLGDRPADLDALALELAHGRFDVITHEGQLVMTGIVSRMGGQLCGREVEDRPPAARVHRRKLEHISQERAHRVCVSGEDDGVDAADHGRVARS